MGHLIKSVDWDVTGPLWRQKAVSYLGWDKSISDTRRLPRTPFVQVMFNRTHLANMKGIRPLWAALMIQRTSQCDEEDYSWHDIYQD